ncbi:MAG: ChbG/HpnK family deacetylase [Bacteroidia bacterium]
MKRITTLLILAVSLWNLACSQKSETIRLIVRGDDMGFSHAANEAIIECYKKGIMTSVEIMPVTPWFPEVVKLCNENPNLDVGIHLALTSEWSNLKWRPLTNAPSISDDDGYFYPMIWPNNNYGESQALKPQEWKIEEIEKEIRAQIELSVKHIPRISHISGHMGFTGMDPKVGEVVKKLAKEYDIDIDPDDYGVKRMRFVGPKDTPENKINSFIKGLEELEPGNTYLFVEHPGYDTPELQAVNHTGYEDVAQDRFGVTQMWTDERVKAAVKKLNIELIDYRDLVGE